MARIIDARNKLENTVKLFDDFYQFKLDVNPSEYDLVNAYFVEVCATQTIADTFTVFLFRIAQQSKTSVMDMLKYIQGKNGLEMNQIMAYYLNTFKSKSTMYGASQTPRPVHIVARNILLWL